MTALALLLLLVGCDPGTDRRFKDQGDDMPVDTATPCATDGDCNHGVGWTCISPGEDYCPECTEPTRECESDDTCDDTQYCRNYEIPCSCAGEASVCVTKCRSDQECASDETCDQDVGRCLPASCRDGFACPAGTECTGVGGDHGCQSIACDLDEDCGEGLYCVDKACYTRQGTCWPED